MKLIKKDLDKDASGKITVIPEEEEDIWHAYNLICSGDNLKATTERRVQLESVTGSADSQRIKVTLTIEVESTEYDGSGVLLRVKGRNIEENKHVKLGAYHTTDIELNRPFTLFKKAWDIIALDRLDAACDVSRRADLAAIVMQEGLANLCLITENMTVVRQRIEIAIPKKRRGDAQQHEKALAGFYEHILQAILKHVRFDVVKCLILASPGFVKDQCFMYIMSEAQKKDLKIIFENKSKFVLLHSSSGHKNDLTEILSNPAISNQLLNTKFAKEIKILQDFYSMLNLDSARAFYGYRHVFLASERGAIQVLLISDVLFRSNDLRVRKKYVALVESVRANQGQVAIFSSLHVSGEQLTLLSGIAAILRFPLPEIEEMEEENDIDTTDIGMTDDAQAARRTQDSKRIEKGKKAENDPMATFGINEEEILKFNTEAHQTESEYGI